MKADEIKKQIVKPEQRDLVGVIAIKDNKSVWFHVHDDEEIPTEGWTIAILPRPGAGEVN